MILIIICSKDETLKQQVEERCFKTCRI